MSVCLSSIVGEEYIDEFVSVFASIIKSFLQSNPFLEHEEESDTEPYSSSIGDANVEDVTDTSSCIDVSTTECTRKEYTHCTPTTPQEKQSPVEPPSTEEQGSNEDTVIHSEKGSEYTPTSYSSSEEVNSHLQVTVSDHITPTLYNEVSNSKISSNEVYHGNQSIVECKDKLANTQSILNETILNFEKITSNNILNSSLQPEADQQFTTIIHDVPNFAPCNGFNHSRPYPKTLAYRNSSDISLMKEVTHNGKKDKFSTPQSKSSYIYPPIDNESSFLQIQKVPNGSMLCL